MRTVARRAIVLALLLLGCGQTQQRFVSFPVHAAGTGESTFTSDEGWSVTIERADLGFGPLYLCATTFADIDVCPQAEAEMLVSGTVDATDDSPQMIGDARAITATVRSAMYDHGRSWAIAAADPAPNPGAPSGHSAVFVVRATRGPETLEVRAEVDIDPRNAAEPAVFGARTGEHAITGEEALVVRFDPAAWWRRVSFDAVAALDDDADGAVTLAPGTVPHDTLVIAMTAGVLPAFEWTEP